VPIELMLGIAAAAVGVLSMVVTWILYKLTTDNQKEIQDLISKITGLFAASQKVGIETAYENRKTALCGNSTFSPRLATDKKLIVVGSSLLGLRMYILSLPEILCSRVERGYETKFMLTHPCFSSFRESQEGRGPGQIRTEIDQTVKLLKDSGLDVNKSLRFYCGTPTCFAIITSEAMLLNPYPYQTEAFKSFCLEVRRLPLETPGGIASKREASVPAQVDEGFRPEFSEFIARDAEKYYDYSMDVGPDIYGQFYWYHYVLPWFSKQAITYEEYCKFCIGGTPPCPFLQSGYSEDGCRIARIAKAKEGTGTSQTPCSGCNE
jgi:hypothetical protein